MDTIGVIEYNEDRFSYMSELTDLFWSSEEFPWEDRGAPRREAFLSKNAPVLYTYGSGTHFRTYESSPIPDFMKDFWEDAEEFAGCEFELCFSNGYANERNHLGWHADDSDSVDDSRPILVVSIGAEREIWFRKNGEENKTDIHKMKLKSGSGLLMLPGVQDTHQHRIPKADRKMDKRISFTFRGLAT